MKVAQIGHILKKIGNYQLDSWIPLDEVSVLYLTHDSRIFTNKNESRFNFGSDNILRICNGFVGNDGLFYDENINQDPTKFNVSSFVDFDLIRGFIRTIYIGYAGTYMKKIIN